MKLLIAYDGSKCADAALDDLRHAGLPHDVEALVLSVADVLLPPVENGIPEQRDPEWLVAVVNNARTRSKQAVEEARASALRASKRIQTQHPGWQVHAEARANSPAWAIIDKAQEWKADLVLVGAHGHFGTGRLVLGSVSQRVVADAFCSVRVGRTTARNRNSPARLIVGFDGSPDSNVALEQAGARAWPVGSAIRLITVIDLHMSGSLAFSCLDPAAAAWLNKKEIDSRMLATRMNEIAAERMRATGCDVSSLVRDGNPQQILVIEAKRWKANCIFVGAKGLRGVERFLIGSVSMAVAARARCSVEVVRSGRWPSL